MDLRSEQLIDMLKYIEDRAGLACVFYALPSSAALASPTCEKSAPKTRRVTGDAAKRFHSSAMGKFLISVPTQMPGSWLAGIPARMMLNRMLATRLIVGHMIRTVQQERMVPWTKALSRSGSIRRLARDAPPRVPHRFENRKTKIHLYAAYTKAPANTSLVILEKPPTMVGMTSVQASL